MNAPPGIDDPVSAELSHLRRQVVALQQALARSVQNHPLVHAKESEQAQQAVQTTFDTHVRERTAGLERAVMELKQEVARRQEAESALKASEQQYQSLYEHNPFMYFTLAPDGIVLSVNRFGAEQLGYQKEDLIGRSIVQVFDVSERQTVLERLRACVANLYTLLEWETQTIRKDGTRLRVKERARAIHDHTGAILVLVVCEDITERKQTEEALRASELRLQQFVAEAPIGLCFLDENRRTISANRAFCELTGYAKEELLGSTYALYTHPEDLSAGIVLTDEFFCGIRSNYSCEKRYIRKSGEIIWVSVKATRIELSGHEGPLLLSAVHDITERKLALEEREQLSRDLHDNLLQALYAVGMQLEAGKLAMKHSARRSKAHMSHAINQLNTLMVDVRRFIARLTTRPRAELDFGHALNQLIVSMTGTDRTAPQLEITRPVLSFVTPQMAEQLLNIAREALSNSMRHAHASHRWVQLSLIGNSIRLVIGDNGVGFLRTRKRRPGHGLSNMAARARRLSGTFTLQSAPRQGTIITVDVPLKKDIVYE